MRHIASRQPAFLALLMSSYRCLKHGGRLHFIGMQHLISLQRGPKLGRDSNPVGLEVGDMPGSSLEIRVLVHGGVLIPQ